jgi:hypothetical protein
MASHGSSECHAIESLLALDSDGIFRNSLGIVRICFSIVALTVRRACEIGFPYLFSY